jgi:hypothetical protein
MASGKKKAPQRASKGLEGPDDAPLPPRGPAGDFGGGS